MRQILSFFALALLAGTTQAAPSVHAEVFVHRLDDHGGRAAQVGAHIVVLDEGKTVPIELENVPTYPMLVTTAPGVKGDSRDSLVGACTEIESPMCRNSPLECQQDSSVSTPNKNSTPRYLC